MKRRGWRHFGSERLIERTSPHDIRSVMRQQSFRERTARLLAAVFTTATAISILLFHPALRINVVTIVGAQRSFIEQVQPLVESLLAQRRWYIIPNNHYFFYPRKAIHTIIQSVVYARSVSVSPQWGGELTIKITPYPVTFYWFFRNQYYTVNKLGIITEQIPKMDESKTIVEDVGRIAGIRRQAMSRGQVDWILMVSERLQAMFARSVNRIILSTTHPEIIQVLIGELFITFNTNDAIEPQILRLKMFLESKPSEFRTMRHTIDLRFKEKVYYE